MASEDVQTNLRLPAELKNALLAAAEKNNRSLSAEVAFRLIHSFRQDHTLLQEGERVKMEQERRQLEMVRELLLNRISTYKLTLKVHGDRAALDDPALTMTQREKRLQEYRELSAAIDAAEHALARNQERLREIDADLRLPDLSADLLRLANEMPR